MTAPPTLGLVLAGGLARRMGGGDKARIKIGGMSILQRVLACLMPQCSRVIINANGDPARFADTGLPVVADSVPDFAGPLAGILAGLDWAAANAPAVEWLVSVPGDCPFLPKNLVARLHDTRASSNVPLACARSGEWRHPVVGLWPVAIARGFAARTGRRKPAQDRAMDGAARHRHRRVADDADRPVLQRQYAEGRRAGRSYRRQISGCVTVLFALRRRQPRHHRAALGFKAFDCLAVFKRDIDVVDAAHQPVFA